ncbi:5-oxoprolinase subunit C family protein [Pseudidiomarina andamanensis]|uniref:Biotin-dependent carboxyltransferase family protein n=1 Tax=Pseudidiomarina andamanensis TaxID=1940690 RepID=A0AA92ERT2_9GAMM|nr:biotin-dependent carboxyltransferase family protein [Pseudidiomarina andamanensis]MDS0218538.1 biotin-dependent carboxyltransferase family protein [Pseudidiomarina andamanensis]QGT95408.1 biotin-dependent carboxyltransferase family protein [Pseudidiomarina andamanensis]
MTSYPALRIDQPGLLTTLQDWGRFGHLSQGITRGGPIDERAFLWANKLLGNTATAAQLEVTLGGLSVTALKTSYWVVCGAPVTVTKSQQPIPTWEVFRVNAGERVRIDAPERGLRSYLAVAGGFTARPVFGSIATVTRDGLGGLHGDGKPLQSGDELHAGSFESAQVVPFRRPQHDLIPRVSSTTELRIPMIPMAQYAQFEQHAQQSLVQQNMQVTAKQDRMGIRLQANQPIAWTQPQIISEPLPLGAIQIPPDGQPIVMLNDCQTLGGYPKIGVVSWSGRMALAQATAGTALRFEITTLEQAQAEVKQAYRFFNLNL